MELILLIYIILGGIVCLAFLIMVLKIAGKDMLFAFFRWLMPKGCYVMIANSNRHFDTYFRVPKDGIFNIKGKKYITNPNKLMGLSEEMVKEVKQSMNLGIQRLNKSISKLEGKKGFIQKKLNSIENKEENMPIIDNLQIQYTDLENKIELLKSKLDKREQSYFMNRRSLYLYIENDMVPKDLFEFYTEMDCIQIENIIVRAQTKPPDQVRDLEKQISFIKKMVIVGAVVGALAVWFAFRSSSMIEQIAQNMGVQLTI